MATYSRVCRAQDIIELNQTKEYVHTAKPLIESILTDPNLNAQTVKLWQLLFNRARFDSNLEIRLSYHELAQLLHRSVRTIARYMKTLCFYGYLELKPNYSLDGGQVSNTMFIRMPMTTIHQAKQTKDRAVRSSFSQAGSCQPQHSATYTYNKEMPTPDKFVMGPHDKSDIANNNINKDNNNNVVVGFFSQNNFCERQSTIHALELQINSILERLPKLQKNRDDSEAMWIRCCEISKQREYQQDFSQKSSQLEQAHAFVKRLELKRQQLLSHEQATTQHKDFINQPPLPDILSQRLSKCLDNLGIMGEKKLNLVNEILFEIGYGALRLNNITGKINSSERVLSIALKLVKEGRWQTPIYFKKEACL